MLDVSAMLSTHTKKSAMHDIMAMTAQSQMPKKGNFPRMLANLQPAEDTKTEDMKSSTRSDEKIQKAKDVIRKNSNVEVRASQASMAVSANTKIEVIAEEASMEAGHPSNSIDQANRSGPHADGTNESLNGDASDMVNVF